MGKCEEYEDAYRTLIRRGLLAMANFANFTTLCYWRLADDLSKDNDPKVAPSKYPCSFFSSQNSAPSPDESNK